MHYLFDKQTPTKYCCAFSNSSLALSDVSSTRPTKKRRRRKSPCVHAKLEGILPRWVCVMTILETRPQMQAAGGCSKEGIFLVFQQHTQCLLSLERAECRLFVEHGTASGDARDWEVGQWSAWGWHRVASHHRMASRSIASAKLVCSEEARRNGTKTQRPHPLGARTTDGIGTPIVA